MRLFFKYSLLFSLSIVLLSSCVSRKNYVYLNDIEKSKSYEVAVYEPILQPDDLLSIIVSSDSPEVTVPFNLPEISGNNRENPGLKTYLIDNNGYIDFPVLGKIKMAGLSRTEANNKLVSGISEYIKNPSVNLRIENYKVSVLGEVGKANTYNIGHERLTLLEALAMAGDITAYGVRNNILIIRESQGKKTFNRVDITKAEFLNSPFYYMAQNDIVYVEANKTKINSSVIGPNIAVIFSGLSLLVTIALILLR